MRLFNDKNYNLHGVGSPYYGNCIVVPNVDYDAYKKGDMGFSNQVEIIKEILFPFTGELDDVYIVPLIRCNENIACEPNDDIYRRCITYFAQDVLKYDFTNILLLGEAAHKFLNCDISKYLDTLLVSKNRRCYNVNYSPLIKYINEEKFGIFTYYLRKWRNWSKDKQYNYKNCISI